MPPRQTLSLLQTHTKPLCGAGATPTLRPTPPFQSHTQFPTGPHPLVAAAGRATGGSNIIYYNKQGRPTDK